MKKFEYKFEMRDFIYEPYHAEENYLAKMGDEGWELVMIKFGKYYYWKREKIVNSQN